MDEATPPPAPPIEGLSAALSTEIQDTAETLGRAAGLLPRLSFFTQAQLTAMLKDSGFTVEHDWQPRPTEAVFIVARMAV